MARCVFTAKGISTKKAKNSSPKETTIDQEKSGERDVTWYDEKTFIGMIESLPCEAVFIALKEAMEESQKASKDKDIDPSLIAAATQAKTAIDAVFAAAADEIWPISIGDTLFGIVWDDRKARADCEMIVDTKTVSLSTIRPNSLQFEAAGFKTKKDGKKSVYKAIFRDIYTIDSPSVNEQFARENVSYASRIDNTIAKKHFTTILQAIADNQSTIDVYNAERASALTQAKNHFYEVVDAVMRTNWPFPVGDTLDFISHGKNQRMIVESIHPQVLMQKRVLSFAVKGHSVANEADKITMYAAVQIAPDKEAQ